MSVKQNGLEKTMCDKPVKATDVSLLYKCDLCGEERQQWLFGVGKETPKEKMTDSPQNILGKYYEKGLGRISHTCRQSDDGLTSITGNMSLVCVTVAPGGGLVTLKEFDKTDKPEVNRFEEMKAIFTDMYGLMMMNAATGYKGMCLGNKKLYEEIRLRAKAFLETIEQEEQNA